MFRGNIISNIIGLNISNTAPLLTERETTTTPLLRSSNAPDLKLGCIYCDAIRVDRVGIGRSGVSDSSDTTTNVVLLRRGGELDADIGPIWQDGRKKRAETILALILGREID
jgi:hypothetical protein